MPANSACCGGSQVLGLISRTAWLDPEVAETALLGLSKRHQRQGAVDDAVDVEEDERPHWLRPASLRAISMRKSRSAGSIWARRARSSSTAPSSERGAGGGMA